MTTKIHLVCDRNDWPLAFTLSPGQQAYSRQFVSTLERVSLPGQAKQAGHSKRCCYMVADKGYNSDELCRYCERHGTKSLIAQRNIHRRKRPGLPRGFDKPKYRQQNTIEAALNYAASPPAMKSWRVALRRWYASRASTVAYEPTFRTKPKY